MNIVRRIIFSNQKKTVLKKTVCYGLASAYLYKTLAIPSHSIWLKTRLSLNIEKENGYLTDYVYNVSGYQSFEDIIISKFIENISELVLLKTDLLPEHKRIYLADHHGKNKLKQLCDRLQRSPYVIEMWSTDWGRNCKKIIRKTEKNGVIEIVLFKEEKPYALRVKTTGRNLRETNAIAEILEEKYS